MLELQMHSTSQLVKGTREDSPCSGSEAHGRGPSRTFEPGRAPRMSAGAGRHRFHGRHEAKFLFLHRFFDGLRLWEPLQAPACHHNKSACAVAAGFHVRREATQGLAQRLFRRNRPCRRFVSFSRRNSVRLNGVCGSPDSNLFKYRISPILQGSQRVDVAAFFPLLAYRFRNAVSHGCSPELSKSPSMGQRWTAAMGPKAHARGA